MALGGTWHGIALTVWRGTSKTARLRPIISIYCVTFPTFYGWDRGIQRLLELQSAGSQPGDDEVF